MPHQHAKICNRVKGKCVSFVMKNLSNDFWQSPFGKEFKQSHSKNNILIGEEDHLSHEAIFFLDHFLLFGETVSGLSVLEAIRISKAFNREEKEILQEWQEKAFTSIFEILEISKTYLKLLDLVGEAKYQVYSNVVDLKTDKVFPGVEHLKPNDFLLTNLTSVKGIWFFSGGQRPFPPEAEGDIFETVKDNSSPEAVFRNNPEKLKRAFLQQEKFYNFFVEFFGSDEVIVLGSKLVQMLEDYYQAWHKKIGSTNPLPNFTSNFPDNFKKAKKIGIVMDKKAGENYFIDYDKFKQAFSGPNLGDSRQQEIVRTYLTDESIPGFLFKRIKDRNPNNFRKTTQPIIKEYFNSAVDPVNHFEIIMDRLKPGWKTVYPSVIPINQRFKKRFYRSMKAERNEPCPCDSGRKFKKCCGI